MKPLKDTILEATEDRYENTWPYDDAVIEEGLKKELPFAKMIKIVHRKGLGNIMTHWITICLQEQNDIPNHIAENAAVYRFVYEGNLKWQLDKTPHMWLSPFDKSGNNEYSPRLQYLAMRSSEDLRKECGMKMWRKCALKTEKDIIKKVSDYVKSSFALVELYTGEYPYTNGILNQSIKRAAIEAGIK